MAVSWVDKIESAEVSYRVDGDRLAHMVLSNFRKVQE
jgi:hypothetical protein